MAVAVAACGSSETAGSGSAARSSGSASASAPSASASSSTDGDNGVSALSAEQILAKAKSALTAADSVKIDGSGADAGTTIKIDMQYGEDGAVGTFTINGQRLDLLRVDEDVYVKGTSSFWTTFANADVARVLGDKYVKTDESDQRFSEIATFTELEDAADTFLEPSGAITKAGAKTVAGVPAIGLESKGADAGTLYVATTGRPYPLSLEGKGNSVTFTDYGKPVTVKAPPAAQVIDAKQLPGS